MNIMLSLVVGYIASATALKPTSAPTTSGPLNSPSSDLPNFDIAAAPPLPSPGESVGQWIDQLFGVSNSTSNGVASNNSALFSSAPPTGYGKPPITALAAGPNNSKRDYTEGYGLHESSWVNETTKVGYNISVDFSRCSTSLRLATDIGVYTFSNGTTTNRTTLQAMVADLWGMRHSRESPTRNYADQIISVAQLAINEANQVLNNGLICQNGTVGTNATTIDITRGTTSDIVHNELRKLLANAWSYWAAVILSAGAGATCGASLAAGMDYRFKGNVTAENTIQTGAVVGMAILVSGILNRMHEVGRLDNAQRIQGAAQAVAANAVQLVPVGREAVVQNVFVAGVRRAIQRVASRQTHLEDALSEAGVSVQSGAREAVEEAISELRTSVAGTTAGSVLGTSDALDHPVSPDVAVCLSDLEAAEAAEAVGQMSDADLGLKTEEYVQQQLAGRAEDGGCGV